MPDLEPQTMAPVNRGSGVVGFEVPVETALAVVHYRPEDDRLVLLANLWSVDGGTPIAAVVPTMTAVPAEAPEPAPKPAVPSTPMPPSPPQCRHRGKLAGGPPGERSSAGQRLGGRYPAAEAASSVAKQNSAWVRSYEGWPGRW